MNVASVVCIGHMSLGWIEVGRKERCVRAKGYT